MRAAGSHMPDAYDVIIIGAGHNGLVTAAYLARAGWRVLVLERRELVGGACVTEELWPGFKVSTASYVNSLLRPEIIRDLELSRYGFELLPRSPSSFTPFPDGRFLLMGPDKNLTAQQVAKFSARDATALPRYEAMLERVADFIEPTLLRTPPNPWSLAPRDLLQLAGLGWRFLRLGRDGPRALEILTGAARPILERLPRRGTLDRLFQRVAQDQRRALRAPRVPRGAQRQPPARRAPARHDPHRAHARLHGAGVRRCQVRTPLCQPDPRVHDSVRRRLDGRAARQACDVVFRAVRAVPAAGRRLGPGEGRVRGSLLRHPRPVRTQLQTLGDRAPGALTARSGASLRPDGRQHLPGGDDPDPALLPAAARRLRRLPRADQGAVPVRRRDASWGRRHGGVRLQCGAGDAAGRKALSHTGARHPSDAGPQWDGAPDSG